MVELTTAADVLGNGSVVEVAADSPNETADFALPVEAVEPNPKETPKLEFS